MISPLLICFSHFNSQPHKEADIIFCELHPYLRYFNSQPHKEADSVSTSEGFLEKVISTHSLTRRLTDRKQLLEGYNKFQLTASQGG